MAVLPAYTVSRFKLQRSLQTLIEALGCPFAVTPMEKGRPLRDARSVPLECICGAGSSPSVLETIEAADLVIDAGGVNFNEINTKRLSEPAFAREARHDRHRSRPDRQPNLQSCADRAISLNCWSSRALKRSGYSAPRRQAHATPGGKPSDPITAATLYPRYRDSFSSQRI